MGEKAYITDDAQFDLMFRLNVSTLRNSIKAAVPLMQKQGRGSIVNIGALGALSGQADMSAYCASKSTVMRLTESLSEELKAGGHQRQCGITQHHRHAAKPRGDAGCRFQRVGIAGETG